MTQETEGQGFGIGEFHELNPDDVIAPLADAAFSNGLAQFPSSSTNAMGYPAAVTVFAEEQLQRASIQSDLEGAGFLVRDGGPLDQFIHTQDRDLGDLAIADYSKANAQGLASLLAMSQRTDRHGGQLIVLTTLDQLDDVFSAVRSEGSQILVNATPAERIVAVGRAMSHLSEDCVRELSEEDKLNLLYLSRQVESIAHSLEGLSSFARQKTMEQHHREPQALLFEDNAPSEDNSISIKIPDPQVVRGVIAARKLRKRYFENELFADPAWDMLLDLTAAHGENSQVSVTSLCIAAEVPATTALRWINQMEDIGIFRRVEDRSDKRRSFITLSFEALTGMARYFDDIAELRFAPI